MHSYDELFDVSRIEKVNIAVEASSMVFIFYFFQTLAVFWRRCIKFSTDNRPTLYLNEHA